MFVDSYIKFAYFNNLVLVATALCTLRSRIESKNSPASDAGNVSEPRLMSQVGRVRVAQCFSAVREVAVSVTAVVAAAVL